MAVQAIGQAVRREEDWRLLRGKGRFVDDAGEPGDARGYVLRSPHAYALIRAVDVAKANTASGVLAVLTGEDLRRRGLGTLTPGVRRRRSNGAPAFVCPQPLLARERVRYVGDPVAFIAADTLNQAKDAAELIEIDYEPLPAVVTAAAALAPGAPPVWEDNPGNEAFFHEIGDKTAVEAALRGPSGSSATKFTSIGSLRIRWSRAAASPNTIPIKAATRSVARSSRCTQPALRSPIRFFDCHSTGFMSYAIIWAAALA